MWNSITGWEEPMVILHNYLQACEIVYFAPIGKPGGIINIVWDIFKVMHLRKCSDLILNKDFVSSP